LNSFFIGFFGRIGTYQNPILMHDIPGIIGDRDLDDQFSKIPFSFHKISLSIYG